MSDAEKAGSVAIIAMGPSKESWFKRAYRGDDPAFYAHVFRQRLQQLVPPEQVLHNNMVRGFADVNLTPEQQAWLDGMAKAFTPDLDQQKMIDDFADILGRQATIDEVGEPYDQVWGINHMGKLLKDLDMIFAMDDLRHERFRYGDMLTGDVPIMTCTKYDEYNCIEYPLSEVINNVLDGEKYITNSVCYAVAYAIYKGYKRIGLYGADFHYPGIEKSEQARANCEWLLGRAEERGIQIEIAEGSTLMDRHKVPQFYGFAEQPIIDNPDGTQTKFNPEMKTWDVIS